MPRFTYIPNRVIDSNGIADGASVYVYLASTTTPVTIYADEALTTPLSNPVVVPAGSAVPPIYYDTDLSVRVRVVAVDGTVVSDDNPYLPLGQGDAGADATELAWIEEFSVALDNLTVPQSVFEFARDFVPGLERVELNGYPLARGSAYTYSEEDPDSITLTDPITDPAAVLTVYGFLPAAQGPQKYSIVDAGAGVEATAEHNTAAVQRALDSGYAEILVPLGEFLCGEVTLPSGVTLVGAGGTIKWAPETHFGITFADDMDGGGVIGVDFDCTDLTNVDSPDPIGAAFCIGHVTDSEGTQKNVRIENNRFRNIPIDEGQRMSAVTFAYGEATVRGNYVDQCGGDILNFNNGYFTVTENFVNNGGDGGIAFNNNARGIISNNQIYKCDLGIGAGHEGTTANPEHFMTIEGNIIRACGDGINMGWFGYTGFEAPQKTKISGNTIDRCKRTGLRYDGRDASSEMHLIIEGNTISNIGTTDFDSEEADGSAENLGIGMFVGGGKNYLIDGNIFDSNLFGDIVTVADTDVNIKGNSFYAGEYANDGNPALYTDAVKGSVKNNHSYGRPLVIATTTRLDISGNTIRGVTSGGGIVIIPTSPSDLTIYDNVFADCGVGLNTQNLAGWFSHGAQRNKFYNCTTKVQSSPLPRDDDDYAESYYVGTADGSGNWALAHGLGVLGRYTIVAAQAWEKTGVDGDAELLTQGIIDGTSVNFSGAAAGATVRAWLRINKDAPAW